MRLLFFTLLLIISSSTDAKSGLLNSYVIVSDNAVENVPAGKCRVKGTVYNQSQTVQDALISTLDRTKLSKTDSLGNFEFYVGAADTSIFFFKKSFTEIVIWNYKFESGHEVVINFYASNNPEIMVVDKPVIYLYSEKSLDVNIQLDFDGDYTFTYPQYNGGWELTVGNNGVLSKNTNLSYPYLFWEGEMVKQDFLTVNEEVYGFLVDTDTCNNFLETSLRQLGLNSTESTDFITFWGPQLCKKKYAFVQFLVDDDYDDNIAGIHVNPQPESMRRVFVLISPMENEPIGMKYKTQELPPFERIGFSLIEWGGSIIDVPQNDL
jgi:hypothetical protein